jgi:hypothetical protein
MNHRNALAAGVLLSILIAAPTMAAAEWKPWTYVKELVRKPFAGKAEDLAPPPARSARRSRKAKAQEPVEAAAPIPRPRPSRTAKTRSQQDFEEAFVPPPILKIPPGAKPVPAAAEPEPAETVPPEPQPIPLGPAGSGSGSSVAFPFPVPRPGKTADPGVEPLAMLPAEPAPQIVRPPAPSIACTASLAALGVDAQPLAPVSEGVCSVAQPTSVSSLEHGAVKLPISAILNCKMAETTALWLRDTVQPAATASFGARVTGLRVAASYDCRTRDRIPGAKMSEHAFGNALDLSAFMVNGRWIEVGGTHEAQEQAFLDTIRTKACGPFKTVLGPGSDGYHSDHMHLDLAKRRTAGPSKGLYCK